MAASRWDRARCIQRFQQSWPYKIPDMSKGFGSALTYNFDPHWGVEFDFGHNWGSGNYEATGSIGPRFIWRTDNANYFLHTLVSLNRVAVTGLDAGEWNRSHPGRRHGFADQEMVVVPVVRS